ncbi:MAG TPA: acyloxyacyl hydrolase [Acidobacteriaceae bacterium]|jgi:opacity protein-like surface antigen|nr:acyloxyacyl hydrolase [Acidobacteriaceae bacterium]
MRLSAKGVTALGRVALLLLAAASLLAEPAASSAQTRTETPSYTRLNTFGFFVSYANDSSHILLGEAANRKLLYLGVSYDRRLILNRTMNWQYEAELMPVALESDPIQIVITNGTLYGMGAPITFTERTGEPSVGPCVATSGTINIPGFESITYAGTCHRRWTIGQAMAPVGLRWNFRPQRRLQPFLDGHGGFMYSTQPIPVTDAGSFNFLFDAGAGLELFRSKTRSVRVEYRYHHISNGNTAPSNPGIDNGLFQVTWAFGH